jgi:hypothetical protein
MNMGANKGFNLYYMEQVFTYITINLIVALGQNDRLAIRKKKVCNISNAADKCT